MLMLQELANLAPRALSGKEFVQRGRGGEGRRGKRGEGRGGEGRGGKGRERRGGEEEGRGGEDGGRMLIPGIHNRVPAHLDRDPHDHAPHYLSPVGYPGGQRGQRSHCAAITVV